MAAGQIIKDPNRKQRDIIEVRVTRNDLAKLLAVIQKKSKSMKATLRHVAAMIAKIHLKHYLDEEGPDKEGNKLVPWMYLDKLYQKDPKKKNPEQREKMLRNFKDRIYNEIKAQTDEDNGGTGIMITDSSFTIGITSDLYARYHDGNYLRYYGDTRAEKRSKRDIPHNKLARRIIGLIPSEEEDVINELESSFFKELEDV